MAGAAELSLGNVHHRVFRVAPLYDREDVGMTEFASVPDRVFLVGEDDVRHPFHIRVEIEILLHGKRLPRDGNAFEKTFRLDQSQLLGFLPVYAVAEALFWQRLTEYEVTLPAKNVSLS
jgi:hypothetical protein